MQVKAMTGPGLTYFSYHDINHFFKDETFVKRIYNHCNKHLPSIKRFPRYDTGCLGLKQHFVFEELVYLCDNYQESHHTNMVNQLKGRELRAMIKSKIKSFKKYLDKLDVNAK